MEAEAELLRGVGMDVIPGLVRRNLEMMCLVFAPGVDMDDARRVVIILLDAVD
jgi:hypothetical protein